MEDCNKLWMCLLIAGICEIIWAVSLGYSEGFTVLRYTVIVLIFLSASVYLLSRIISGGIPVGTAYAVGRHRGRGHHDGQCHSGQ